MDKRQTLKEQTNHGTVSCPVAAYRFENSGAWQVMPHWHDENEIICLKEGSLTLRINTREYPLHAPVLVCIAPGEIHSIEIAEDAQWTEESAVVFRADILGFAHYDAVQEKLIAPVLEGICRFPVILNPTVPGFEQLWTCYEQLLAQTWTLQTEEPAETEWELTYFQIKIGLFQFVEQLYRSRLMETVSGDRTADAEIESIKKVLSYIGAHYDEPIRLQTLADLVNMNSQYFCRYFKKKIGRTITEYVNDIRLHRAADELLSTEKKVITIAQDCGFDNIGYFIRKFRAFAGVTPGEYRKRRGESMEEES
ncbi:MAG: helix-turn-helix domain-containing protein [Lachnospiraceae bacterium]|nr:helix-turn-helix domain-containing protein [Lachnospiraceae bacterium]